MSEGGPQSFVFLSEQRRHENEGDGPDPETTGGPGHHQAGDGELGAEGGEEEAESHPGHGHRDGGQEDDVDVLAVQQGQQQRGAQVAQCDKQLYIGSRNDFLGLAHLEKNCKVLRFDDRRFFKDDSGVIIEKVNTTDGLKNKQSAGQCQGKQERP